jgi:hypothetical protein
MSAALQFETAIIEPVSNWQNINAIINNQSHHGGRVTKKARQRIYDAINKGDNVLVIAALLNGQMVGVSCALLSKKMARNSFTIVTSPYQKRGIGRNLLAAKLLAIYAHYPNATLTSYVGMENKAGHRICELNGLRLDGERTFTLDSGKEIRSKVYSNVVIAT